MNLKQSICLASAAALVTLSAASCSRNPGILQPAPAVDNPIVFADGFGANTDFEAFRDSKLDALSVDAGEKHQGSASLLITVPAKNAWAGGAITTKVVRDFTAYDALTFWAKASVATTLDLAGFGNNNKGTSKYEASWKDIPLTTSWKKYVIPIPRADRLTLESGLFFFSQGPKGNAEHKVWFDDIKFETVGTISNPRPIMMTMNVETFAGATVTPEGCRTTFDVAGTDGGITQEVIQHQPGYFTFISSNESVARVIDGLITIVGGGSATITARLGGVDVTGALNVRATAPPAEPAPTPTVAPSRVKSLFSNAYSNVTVDTWSADWDSADVSDVLIAGNDTKVYTNLKYAGIEFITRQIDATAMTQLHLDVWVPGGTQVKVKLADFGADGAYGGGDDRESIVTLSSRSTPPLVAGSWVGFDIPLTDFSGLTSRAHLAQLILSGNTGTVYLDNIYFNDLPPPPPGHDPVVFDDEFGAGVDFQAFQGSNLDALGIDTSEHYQGTASLKVTVPASDGWAGGAFTAGQPRDLSVYTALTFWAKASVTTVLDVGGLGNDNTGTSKYDAQWKNIQLTTTWAKYVIPIPRPDRLTLEKGLFYFAQGPKGSSGHQIWFDEIQFENLATIANPRPAMMTKTMGTFAGATVTPEGCQTVFAVGGVDERIEHMPGYFTFASSNTAVVEVVDGVIRAVGAGTARITAKLGTVDVAGTLTLNVSAPPATPAPTPAVPAANVISLFSDAYDNVTVDTWSANWDQADVSDLQIAGNNTKVYRNLVYAGIEFTSQLIDATTMSHFHMDVWAPGGTNLKVKLVDFGADGAYGGGDDREQELTFTPSSTPPLVLGAWVGLEIPLASFTGLTTRGHLAQLIISGDVGTVYVDNIYFHR